jgi:cytochrome c oxidase assembly protein subunit 15
VTPLRFHRLAVAATALLAAIVVTGAAVRLTSSGLGCPTWPRCTDTSLVAPPSYHALVEFVNRVVSALVGIVVALVAVAAVLRRPWRRDLIWLAAGLVAGFLGQAVLGGLSVVFGLAPGWVMAHFLLSMVLLWAALLLVHRSDPAPATPARPVRAELRWLALLVAGTASVVLLLGTVTTGTGPHAGDSTRHITRLPFALERVTQLHADAALLLTGLIVASLFAVRLTDAAAVVRRRAGWLAATVVLQVAIGYVQYFLDLPPGVVGLHVAGATALWCAAVWFALACTARHPQPAAADGRHDRLDAAVDQLAGAPRS